MAATLIDDHLFNLQPDNMKIFDPSNTMTRARFRENVAKTADMLRSPRSKYSTTNSKFRNNLDL